MLRVKVGLGLNVHVLCFWVNVALVLEVDKQEATGHLVNFLVYSS